MKLSLILGTLAIGALFASSMAACATAEPVSFVGVGGAAGTVVKGGSAGKGGTGGSGGTHSGGSSNGGSSNGGTSNGGSSNGGNGNGGSYGGGGSGGGSGTCTLGTGDATCDNCITSKCNAVCLACENNSDCLDLLDCIGNCSSGDTTCQENCQMKYPNGVDDALALAGTEGCLGTTCATACGGGGGGSGGGGGLPSGCYETGVPNCNPLNNDGCASDEACDLSSNLTLECFPPPNTAKLGGACDPTNGPFCAGGLHCAEGGVCGKFCCSSSECGGGTCTVLDSMTGTLGVCE